VDLEKLVLPLEVSQKAFNTGITAAIAGTTTLIGAMGLAIKATFDWAEGLDSIGDVMDVTTGQAAAFGYVARKSGVATETFTKGVVILSKGLVKADGSLDTTGKGLEEWGIKVKDANGNLKSQTTLMDDVAKKYGTFATQQEKVNFLTQVFGKSGAELIDFFDVLANEGGIDAVTAKVTAMGLAIDPGRYEAFGRNLEELKLIGTGLAVTFTEQLMPALEGLLNWGTQFASADPSTQLSMLADPLKKLFNLTDAFKTGVEETDWAGLSTQIADKINSIDWATVGLYLRQGMTNVFSGIQTVISEIDWGALTISLGDAIAGLTAGLFGYTDWNALGVDFNAGINSIFSNMSTNLLPAWTEVWTGFVDGIKAIWQGFLDFFGATKNAATATPGRAVTGGQSSVTGGGNPVGVSGFNYNVTTPGRNVQGGRASGGAVMAGQAYNVGEFGPEKFTPAMNGRIDPMGGGTKELLAAINNNRMDENRLARAIVIALKQGMAA